LPESPIQVGERGKFFPTCGDYLPPSIVILDAFVIEES